jgi:hypothetical protein
MNHLGAIEIHAQINKVLGEETVGYSTITQYVQKHGCPDSSEAAEEETEIGRSGRIDPAILQALSEQPFASLLQLANRISISATTIRYQLARKMRCKIKHCK